MPYQLDVVVEENTSCKTTFCKQQCEERKERRGVIYSDSDLTSMITAFLRGEEANTQERDGMNDSSHRMTALV